MTCIFSPRGAKLSSSISVLLSSCKDVRFYLLQKSGVDRDVQADHQACNSAYQHVVVALFLSALYRLSQMQDIKQSRCWLNSS